MCREIQNLCLSNLVPICYNENHVDTPSPPNAFIQALGRRRESIYKGVE